MNDPLKKILVPLKETQNIRGVDLPIGLEFLQLVVTGPPGAGKSYYIDQIGGWPNEGYIDLSRKGWWKDQSLTFRPREVHLGLPFKGFKEAQTVFDKEWLEADTPPQLELERIILPPDKESLLTTNWNSRYIFEFLIPNAKTIFSQRTERQDEGYFPVDDDLSLEMVEQQLNIYRETALYLHKAGMQVYIRKGLGEPPMIIVEKGQSNVPLWSVEKKPERPSLKSFAGWRWLLFRYRPIHWITVTHEESTVKKSGRVAHDGRGFELILGKQSFYFQPETPLGVPKKNLTKNWTFSCSLHCSTPELIPFFRIADGETTVLGHSNQALSDTIKLKKSVANRHVSISNVRGDLIITPLDYNAPIIIKRLNDLDHREKLESNRYSAFVALRKLFNGDIRPLDNDLALALIRQVNNQLPKEPNRATSSDGTPGAILHLPNSTSIIVVGDLHAQVDNLLKILTENCIIHSLRKKAVTLLILGDAIHSEIAGEMEDMESSMLIMDIIFKLKSIYPEQIHYLRGNHDSFNTSISKNGILQGLLFYKYLKEQRGDAYIQEMETFWQNIPYIVTSPSFFACHAGPPITNYSKKDLINLSSNPILTNEIITNRVERPGTLKGYNKSDVKKFRATLGQPKGTPLLVGHTPLDPFASSWRNAGAIKNHHIIYSAHTQGPSLFIQSHKKIVSISYPYEPLTKLINKLR